jgi:hypothetical protein
MAALQHVTLYAGPHLPAGVRPGTKEAVEADYYRSEAQRRIYGQPRPAGKVPAHFQTSTNKRIIPLTSVGRIDGSEYVVLLRSPISHRDQMYLVTTAAGAEVTTGTWYPLGDAPPRLGKVFQAPMAPKMGRELGCA